METNLEAAEEIARQLRLRDIGGIIVVDFIDMKLPENKKKLAEQMEDSCAPTGQNMPCWPLANLA